MFESSRYNFMLPMADGALLYSAKSGAVLQLSGRDGKSLGKRVSGIPRRISGRNIPSAVLHQLISGGFVVTAESDELKEIRDRFLHARSSAPIVITITTTLDCNLGCYYCYEERSGEALDLADLDNLLLFIRERLQRSDKKSLHVDWYGGEPLLNQKFIDEASVRIQALCADRAVSYAASIISNGTCWPPDVEDFVARNKVRQVQISFDGLKPNHDRRRRYRSKTDRTAGRSSFYEAVSLVDRLVNVVRVDLRFNIDKRNSGDFLEFFSFAELRGWFCAEYPAVIQPARISSYSERSNFLRKDEITVDEFSAMRRALAARFRDRAKIEESEAPDGFPYPKTSVCAALAPDSAVLGADKKIYRCGLQVSEPMRSTGELSSPRFKGIPIYLATQPKTNTENQSEWWATFDPTLLPTCAKCSFLPICWAGCPKKHLDGDHHAIAEQGRFWRSNLSRLIVNTFPDAGAQAVDFTLSDQFRD